MKLGVLVAVLLMFSVSGAKADLAYKDANGNGYALKDVPCSHEVVLTYISLKAPSEMRDKFKDAVLIWQGRKLASCWVERNGYILGIDEDGDVMSPIPVGAFMENTI